MELAQRLKFGVSAVVIASISYWALGNRGGLEPLLAALHLIGGAQLAAGCAVCAATLLVRFARWQAILSRMGHRLDRLFSLRVYLAGIALAWTPGKLGETLRSLLLLPAGVPWHQSVGAFGADRLSDVIGVALLGMMGGWLAGMRQPLLELLFGAVLALSLLLALALRHNWRPRLPSRFQRWQDWVTQPASAWAGVWRLPGVAGYVAAALVAYGMQAAVFAAFAISVAPQLGWAQCLAWFSLAVFVGAASLMPAGLGALEAALVLQLVAHQVPWPDALAVAFATRASTLGVPMLLGLATLASFSRHQVTAERLRKEGEPG